MNKQKLHGNIKSLSDMKKIELNTIIIRSEIKIAVSYTIFFVFMALAMNLFVFAFYLKPDFLLTATIFAGGFSFIFSIIAIALMTFQNKVIVDFLAKNRKKETR